MNIQQLIKESIQGYHIPKKGCSCGCNTCDIKKSVDESADIIKFNIDDKKPLKDAIKEHVNKLFKESQSSIIKIEGVLTSDTTDRTQADILSDIRSISGITIVSSEDITNGDTAYSNDFYNSHLNIKIDPHPFIGRGGFGNEQLKEIIINIKKIKGVRNFKLTTKPQRQSTT